MFSENSGIQKNSIEIKEFIPVETNGIVVYRIFNFYPQGYIIISADDNAEPLIGFGLNSNFSFDNVPPALLFLLEDYKKEMSYIIEKKLKGDETIVSKWEKFSNENYISLKSYSVGTFLLETTWGQGNKYSTTNYNKYCPVDPNTNYKCIAGCTAVALAQILHYWQCQVFPDGTESYTPPGFSNPLPTVYFYNEDYDWDEMNHNSPDDDNAELIYHCGVAINVMYTDSSTGGFDSNVRYAMEDYFGFQTSGLISKSGNETEWINMLRADIDAGRPIYYAGSGNDGRHGWVIDGYKTNNTFHCNWGWENSQGENDEWYLLSSLNPRDYDGFTSDQKAILGAEPILDACSGLTGESVICYPDTVQYSVTIPSTASVVWNVTGNLAVVGSNTSTTCNVRSTSNSGASGTINATIKNSQNQTFLTRSKTVWVGKPFTPVIDGSTYITCDSELFTEDNGKTVTWSVYGPMQIVGQTYGYRCTIEGTGNGYGWVYATSSNICQNITSELFVEVECGYLLVLSPNPANGETILSIESTSEKKIIDETVDWELEVYDNIQNLKLKNSKVNGKEFRFNTSGWKEGIYVARVKYNNEILTGKLVVKK